MRPGLRKRPEAYFLWQVGGGVETQGIQIIVLRRCDLITQLAVFFQDQPAGDNAVVFAFGLEDKYI